MRRYSPLPIHDFHVFEHTHFKVTCVLFIGCPEEAKRKTSTTSLHSAKPPTMMKSTQGAIRSRKSHHKSRLGCGNCKKRRIKCDEKKPACIKCTNHSIECDFSSEAASSSDSPSSETAAHVSSTARFRFKPSKYQSEKRTSLDETAQISQEEVSATAEPNIPVLLPQSRDTISFEDLELFHHFVTETHRTLVDEATDRHRIWQTHLPKWGFSSPSIFHLILTMAALHKGHLYPEIREQYVMQADSHFTFGIRSVSAILSSLDSDNCQLIYMSAVLICLVYFAHGPRTGEYLVFSETGKAEWLVLMRGVRSILTSNREKIFTGVLEIQIDPTVQGVSPLLQTELREHQFRIEEVRRFIEMKLGEGSCGIYLGALDNLMEMFEESYQTLSAGKDGICLMSFVVGWIYRLPEEFVGLLEEKDPISLIILAYWCVLLKFMKSSWLMIGWDRHVLGGIQASLSEDLHRWIEWPVRVICG